MARRAGFYPRNPHREEIAMSRLTRTPGTRNAPNRRNRLRPQLELLEGRALLATFLVTNTGDNGGIDPAPGAGKGTLRQAIIDANNDMSNQATDTIDFAICGAGMHTIQPLTNL